MRIDGGSHDGFGLRVFCVRYESARSGALLTTRMSHPDGECDGQWEGAGWRQSWSGCKLLRGRMPKPMSSQMRKTVLRKMLRAALYEERSCLNPTLVQSVAQLLDRRMEGRADVPIAALRISLFVRFVVAASPTYLRSPQLAPRSRVTPSAAYGISGRNSLTTCTAT